MTYFNLIKENVLVNQVDFIAAVNKGVEFSITHEGEIVYTPIARPVIFTGKAQRAQGVTTKAIPITQTLGRNYNITLKGPQLEIKASTNWQDIIGFNMAQAHYDDSTGDGISVFGDKEMEDMGWHATDFDIDYRTIVEYIEPVVAGVIFCIERDEPYQFSGFGFFDDIEEARQELKSYLIKTIQDKLENDSDYAKDELDDDQLKALEFFGL